GGTAGLVSRLEYDHPGAALRQVGGRDQPIVAAAHHDRVERVGAHGESTVIGLRGSARGLTFLGSSIGAGCTVASFPPADTRAPSEIDRSTTASAIGPNLGVTNGLRTSPTS